MGDPVGRLWKNLTRGVCYLLALLAASAANAGTVVYTYDALGRLIAVEYANGAPASYSYDAAGNRTQYVAGAKPVANPVSATVAYGSSNDPITLNVTGAYTSVAVSTGASHGAASASQKSIAYSPNSGYSGADSFQYTATNADGTSAPATVSITVSAILAPIANPVSAAVAYNSGPNPIRLNITGGTPASVAVASNPTNGTAAASGVSITYQPHSGYSGADSFTYTASNSSGTSAAARVSVTVSVQAPIANPVSATVAYNSGANPITLNITGGAPTSVSVASSPANGTAVASGTSITYQPNNGYSGSDSFTYTATNNGGTSGAARVSVTVTAPPFGATIMPGPVSASGPQTSHLFGANTVTVIGGSGSYTYLWSTTANTVNNGNPYWNTGGTGASFAPYVQGVTTTYQTFFATYVCTVTDTVTHNTTTSGGTLYKWENTTGIPPNRHPH